MLKALAVTLLAAGVATVLSAGLAQARIAGMSSSLTHAHFPTCAEGMVNALCVCRAADRRNSHQLCAPGRYCHTFDGACRQ